MAGIPAKFVITPTRGRLNRFLVEEMRANGWKWRRRWNETTRREEWSLWIIGHEDDPCVRKFLSLGRVTVTREEPAPERTR
jgi:hypothetical protein